MTKEPSRWTIAMTDTSPSKPQKKKRSKVVTTKPISELLDPVMADPERRRRIKAYLRLMDKPVTLRDLRRSRGLTQGALADRLKRSQENVSRLEREDDPRLSTIRNYVAAIGDKVQIIATFDDQETPVLIRP